MISSDKTSQMSIISSPNRPLISIVVAVYNAEQFVERCINSIIDQTYENLEIILVDDGSTDRSGIICDQMGALDRRIRVIHKENGDGRNPTNVGIEASNGSYIGIVDDDDYICKETYAEMVELILSENVDMVVCNYAYVNEKGEDLGAESPIIEDEIISPHEYLRRLTEPMNSYYVTCWNRLYKRWILENNPFPVGYVYGDSYNVHRFIDKCHRIAITKNKYFFYTQREGSQSRSSTDYRFFNLIDSYAERVEYFYERDYYDLIHDTVEQLADIYVQIRRRYLFREKKRLHGHKTSCKIRRKIGIIMRQVRPYCHPKTIGRVKWVDFVVLKNAILDRCKKINK